MSGDELCKKSRGYTLTEWHNRLLVLAQIENCRYIISTNSFYYLASYDSDYTPQQEIEAIKDSQSRNQKVSMEHVHLTDQN